MGLCSFKKTSDFMVMITLYADFNSIKEKISRHFGCHRQDREYHFNSYAYVRHTGLIPGLEDALEKEMAIHPRILSWEISWTEKPGRYSL